MAQADRDASGKQQIRPQDVRTAAFIYELDQAAEAYREVLREFEVVRQRFEIAKERLIAIRRRAPDILPRRDWADWQYHNEDLWAIGEDIGETILTSLRAHAIDAAMKSLDSNGVVAWDPTATTEQIVAALDEHGFEFRTGTPRREVHAALLRLKGVSKTKDGRFAHGEAREIYASMQEGWPRDAEAPPADPPKPIYIEHVDDESDFDGSAFIAGIEFPDQPADVSDARETTDNSR